MRKIAATYIFPGNRAPLKNGILICSDNGTIIDIIDTHGELHEQADLEFYSGVLVPGFINTHCHLELSFLKGKIPEKSGLKVFLDHIRNLRNENPELINDAIRKGDFQMQTGGIVAVGDISNTSSTYPTKKLSSIWYHTFIESFGIIPDKAEEIFKNSRQLEAEFLKNGLPVSITPHANYSISNKLLSLIIENIHGKRNILSVHHLESKEERMFLANSISFLPSFLNKGDILPSENPIENLYSCFPKENNLLLIHNTVATANDILELKNHRSLDNTFFVLCPNSNLYIEDALPPLPLFLSEKVNICIGTDSLASNHKLSVLEEMITFQTWFPEIKLQQLIEWACINGAKALGLSSEMGSFEKGKTPGINLLTCLDLQRLKLTASSKVTVLQKLMH